MFALEGKVALVTGASQGLGRGLAITLARHGCSVVLAARQRDKLEAVRHEIEAAGGAALVVPCDLGDRDAIKAAAEASETKLGPVSILVNNAGVALSKPVMEQSEEDWDLVLGTNLKGAFLMAQAAARRMIANRVAGSIINIVSVLGLGVVGHLAPYCAAKAGLIHLTKAMAFELARHDIRSNAIAPGYIETDMNRSFFRTEQGQKLIRKIPQRRLGQDDDLAGALLLFASDASRYMTGTVLTVDGGFLLA
jgi:3-oxoacyl-[acyl-carrier protein] reductase